MLLRLWPTAGLVLGLLATACASGAPSAPTEEQARSYAVVSVERTDPASGDATGNASAVARFISVPAYSEASRALQVAGVALALPAMGTCQSSDSHEDLEPPPASQDPVELVEAGDVTIDVAGTVTPLVPHAFPSVGTFASGVLYSTRDRESAALPSGVPYVVGASGSTSLSALHLAVDAPHAPTGITVSGTALKDLGDLFSAHALELSWQPGDPGDVVYVELMAYDGSPSLTCTFADERGAGTVPSDTFTGLGGGRIAVHRLGVRRGSGADNEVRFDFQVGAAVEFVK
jgi:hypothetical protein